MLGSVSTSDFTEAGECMPVMYNNNLGCIHFHLSKHHLGAFHFRKAFQENENAIKDIKRGAEHSKLAQSFLDASVFLDCCLFEITRFILSHVPIGHEKIIIKGA